MGILWWISFILMWIATILNLIGFARSMKSYKRWQNLAEELIETLTTIRR